MSASGTGLVAGQRAVFAESDGGEPLAGDTDFVLQEAYYVESACRGEIPVAGEIFLQAGADRDVVGVPLDADLFVGDAFENLADLAQNLDPL